jgi:leucyl/phenylalanyl-tRNA---protein transferase
MSVIILPPNATSFPSVNECSADGLLAMGGNLTPQLVKAAYKKGIFPWYEGDYPLWWSPDPRFVLYPNNLHIQKSMRPLLNQNKYKVLFNYNFEAIIHYCKNSPRHGQDGTWITDAMEQTYTQLFYEGVVVSAACYNNAQLIGGLYGVIMGKVFSGESMFALQPNASKFAFIKMIPWLQQQGVEIIDCQTYTEHLEQLGAEYLNRADFLKYLV